MTNTEQGRVWRAGFNDRDEIVSYYYASPRADDHPREETIDGATYRMLTLDEVCAALDALPPVTDRMEVSP